MVVKFRGFVLLAVLIFLQIFSMLSLYGLAMIRVQHKTNQHYWQHMAGEISARNKLLILEQKLLSESPECLREIMPVAEIIKKHLVWWQQNACTASSDTQQYYFFTEYLGKHPCVGVTISQTKQIVAANYYRITLLAYRDHFLSSKLLLQSVVVSPGDQAILCPDTIRTVRPGMQQRRELYS